MSTSPDAVAVAVIGVVIVNATQHALLNRSIRNRRDRKR